MNKHLYLLCFSLLFSTVLSAQLLRGPYLQKQTSTSMNVKWRTATMTSGKVYYGTDMNNLNLTATDTVNVADHDVHISGLQPFTKYYYKIESDNVVLSGPDNNHHFKTAPVPGTVQPIRVWAIGDFGKGNTGERETRNSYLQYAGNTHTDVWLWLGDNAYDNGTDQEYQNKVFDTTNAFGNVFKYMHFYPNPGNHDYGSVCPIPCQKHPDSTTGPYYDIITVSKFAEAGGVRSDREHFYSFDYGNIHFISLNSELSSPTEAFDWNGAFTNGFQNSPLHQWLVQDLQNNTQPWIVAYWHQPPYSRGSHNSDNAWELYMKAMRQNILPILEQHGVDVVVNGHSHVYERSYLINGHYGLSNTYDAATHLVNGTSGNETLGESYVKYTDGTTPNKGTVYVVSGNAGSSTSNPPFATTSHKVMYFNDGGSSVYGSFIMDVDGNKLTGKYLTSDGIIKDQFTILKQSSLGVKEAASFFENVSDVQIAPNPFSKVTQILFKLKKESKITVDVFSLDGKLVQTIFSGTQTEGKHSITLDATSAGMANGRYILRITEGKNSAFEQVIKVD
jgi:hypothetical protein